jgi:PAS domain S-box-containing protein
MESEKLQGELAARYALRILKGEPASSIPIAMESPNETLLNYRQLKRFGIPDGRIPEGAVIVNRPQSVFSTYRTEMLTLAFIFVSMITLIVLLFMNVLSRKNAEKKANEALLRQHHLVRAASVGLWDWDLSTNNIHYSDEWKRQIGYEANEISDDLNEWKKRVHPDDLIPTLVKVQKSIDEVRQDHEVEFRFRHKDGTYRWILSQASVFPDDSGEPKKMVGSHVDITERKRAENALIASKQFNEKILSKYFRPENAQRILSGKF